MPDVLPTRARIVIIGGGVGGASVAYHLAERGERDVLLLERSELTSGSTFHSAGLVGQLRSDPALTRMNVYSAELYRKLEAGGGEHAPGWVESGSLRLASSPERLEEIRRQAGWAARSGLPLELISAEEARELFPLMSTDGVLGAAYTPTDGHVDPSRLCYALAALARANGVTIAQRTRVVGINIAKGQVSGVRTDQGDVECEIVVDCGGMFAAEIGRLAGVRIPVVPMSHQYVVTAPLPVGSMPADRPLPSLRDPDLLVYYRQEVDGLVMGGYERQSAPWTASARSYDAVPADFNGKLLSPDWDRFSEIIENAQVRVPVLADTGITTMINGPEAFTPDNEFCLGETDVAGFFVAAGFCAHGIAGAGGIGRVMADWVLDGDPGMDLWHMDVRRFGRHYRSPGYTLVRTVENYESYYDIRYPAAERSAGRPLRTSPAYSWHAAHGAVFGEKAGWERVNHYSDAGSEQLRPRGWAGRHWSPCVEPEHRAVREAAGLFDESSFAKISISGTDAAAFCAHVFAGRVDRAPGAVVYTQALNDRGGIEMDVTLTRLAEDEFLVVTGTAFGTHDLGWLRRQARLTGASVRLADVTGAEACFGLWGPQARELLAPLTPASLGSADFPFGTMQETTVGDIPVRAVRVTFVGELGWELYCSTEFGAALWRTLADTGARPCGYRAIESLRLEKGYRVWGADITPETTPDEAGLAFAVRKEGEFVGRAALLAARERGLARTLRCLVLDDPRAVALGGEPVRLGGEVVGQVTSGGYGYTVARSIAYAYLPAGTAEGTELSVQVDGTWERAAVAPSPLYDPRGERIRA
ncbi:4-methylaminobutanoate oxidase (formaldehyde-forming) [Pseudonocardia hierapolitana]|uniref:4-methylaminobutanoate oxidase (Formaldehyde-forming) n=1 Tax=Pseudonocardia hierapolitana TaxID=1128676 RepID=A0A561T2S9_9PSEU|nr:FAD-dependent oxidoreductase [Pseudonocardia hierapolitana]TWF81421.1 4-methylaminobutanoate oxidase (formaldehyde-forming) [Pseudonocardia hierapolitana]